MNIENDRTKPNSNKQSLRTWNYSTRFGSTVNPGMVSQHGIGLWTQTAWFKVVLAQPTQFVLFEVRRNCFHIRLVHILGTKRVFEGARIDQAFSTLARKVNAIFFLHTRREGIRVGVVRFGEIKHSHLRLDKPFFLSRGQSAPRLLSQISRVGISVSVEAGSLLSSRFC